MPTTTTFAIRLRIAGRIIASGFASAWSAWKGSRLYKALTVSAVLLLIVEELVFGVALAVLGAAYRALLQVVALPIGIAGLGLLILIGAWVCILLFKAYRETRPYERLAEAEKRNSALEEQVQALADQIPAKPRPRTSDEEATVYPLRVLWNLSGRPAADLLNDLFEFTKGHWRCRGDYASLLDRPAERMTAGINAMNRAIDPNGRMLAPEIHDQFREAYNSYYSLCYWIARISAEQELQNKNEEFAHKRNAWAEAHRRFYDELERAGQLREHEGKLHFGLQIHDKPLRDFLSNAQIKL